MKSDKNKSSPPIGSPRSKPYDRPSPPHQKPQLAHRAKPGVNTPIRSPLTKPHEGTSRRKPHLVFRAKEGVNPALLLLGRPIELPMTPIPPPTITDSPPGSVSLPMIQPKDEPQDAQRPSPIAANPDHIAVPFPMLTTPAAELSLPPIERKIIEDIRKCTAIREEAMQLSITVLEEHLGLVERNYFRLKAKQAKILQILQNNE
ncbi:hypothetical protein ONZ45_g4414 [Pleurotus djamor]|nr:hypothetical protein ONZ45_g4414 [Pleurotus djamor]